jgi:hypothetical protein
MSAGQIADHDCCVILDPDVLYIQDRRTGHLVGTGPVVMIHSVFGCLTGFIFLPLRPPVLSALPVLLHPHRHFPQWHHRLGHLSGPQLSTLLH